MEEIATQWKWGPPTQTSSHFSGSFFSSRKDTGEMQGRSWTHHPNPSQRPWDTVNILETWRPRALPGSTSCLQSLTPLEILKNWRCFSFRNILDSVNESSTDPKLSTSYKHSSAGLSSQIKDNISQTFFYYVFPVPKHYPSRSKVKIIHAFHNRHLFINHAASTELDPWQYKGWRRNTQSPHTKWVLGNNKSPALYKYLLKTLSRNCHLTSCTKEEGIRLREVRWFI